MHEARLRRLPAGIAGVALAAAIAGCSSYPSEPPPAGAIYPPPPAYGATRLWTNPNAPAAIYAVTTPLHLRTGPGVNLSIIATLAPGTRVASTGSQQGDWWEVQTPDGTGWVSSRYLAPG